MLESLQLSTPLRVLDLASGQGDGARHFVAIGAHVQYLDRSEEMLATGIARGLIPASQAIVHDLRDFPLPFADGSFDAISIRYALHDVVSAAGLLREVSRLLAPEGRFQITDMCARDPETAQFIERLHALKTNGPPIQVTVLDERRLVALLESEGFAILNERWHVSVVSSNDWIAEGQINAARRNEMLPLVRAWKATHLGASDELHARLSPSSFRLSFPVIILTVVRSIQTAGGGHDG
jgi:SAM-dependent methyltransferase